MAAKTATISSRDEVLRRIRAAIGENAADAATIHGEWASLSRNYKRTASLDRAAILDLLEDRLRDYDANVVRVNSGEVASTIARILEERVKRRLVIPPGLAEALGEPLPGRAGIHHRSGFVDNRARRL